MRIVTSRYSESAKPFHPTCGCCDRTRLGLRTLGVCYALRDRRSSVKCIGVILGGRRGPDPHFLKWEDGPPLYKYTKSEIVLGPPLFRPQLRHW